MAEAVSSQVPVSPAQRREQRARDRRWLVLTVILSATFMQLLDISIVGVAIASIQQTLGASYADTQLVLVGYQIGFAATLILAARLGDIYGRRQLFLVGMAAFAAASIACGLAGSSDMLLVARVVQGVASSLMFAQVLAFIQVLFDAKERGAALGAYGTTIGLGTILGPVAGGALIKADLSSDAWRPIFLVNVPIGIAAFAAAVYLLPDSRAPRRPRLDVPGVLLSAAGLGAVLYAVSEGRTPNWPLWLLTLLGAGIAVLAEFIVHERRLSRDGRDPILDTALFGDRAFRVGAALNLVFYAGVPGFFLVFSLYLQQGQGFSAFATGLAIFAYALGAAITASCADGIAVKIGNRILALGAGLLVLGMLTLLVTATLVGTDPHVYSWIPGMLLSGLGFGLFVPPVIDIVLVNVDRTRAGIASGTLATAQQVGGAVGVAAIGIVFFGLIGQHAPGAPATPPPRSAAPSPSWQEPLPGRPTRRPRRSPAASLSRPAPPTRPPHPPGALYQPRHRRLSARPTSAPPQTRPPTPSPSASPRPCGVRSPSTCSPSGLSCACRGLTPGSSPSSRPRSTPATRRQFLGRTSTLCGVNRSPLRNRSTGMKLDGIMIWVADVAATVALYEKAFGLEVAFTDDSGQYVQMISGQTTLSFAHEGAATANGATIRPNRLDDTAAGVQLAMVCDDVTADFQRAIDAGATLVAALTEKPWGQTLGYLRDLNGFLVELSSPAAW